MQHLSNWLTWGVGLAVLASALALVHLREQSRGLYTELQSLQRAGQELETTWRHWQLEHATETQSREIEQQAREDLGMREPQPPHILIVEES